MIQFNEEYLVDEQGNRKAVVLSISEWEQILDALEELDDIRAYDEANGHASEPLTFEHAIAEIRKGRTD